MELTRIVGIHDNDGNAEFRQFFFRILPSTVARQDERLRLQLNDLLIVQIALIRADHLILLELSLEARLIVKDVVVDADHRVDRTDRIDELGIVGIRDDDARQWVGYGDLTSDTVRDRDCARVLRLLCRLLPAAHEGKQETEDQAASK